MSKYKIEVYVDNTLVLINEEYHTVAESMYQQFNKNEHFIIKVYESEEDILWEEEYDSLEEAIEDSIEEIEREMRMLESMCATADRKETVEIMRLLYNRARLVQKLDSGDYIHTFTNCDYITVRL